MILNSYAILLAFVGSIRLLVAALLLVVALVSRSRSLPHDPGQERRGYLVVLLTVLLLVLSLAAWPLLYLLLLSYVPEWPGVMCIYGVTRIGADAPGASGYLPALLTLMQILEPLVVFLGGGWFALYLLNRRTVSGPLAPRLASFACVLAALALLNASAGLAYLAIPKKEILAPGGCCTESFDRSRYLPTESLVGSSSGLWFVFSTGHLVLLVALSIGVCRLASLQRRLPLAGLLVVGLLMLVVGGVFLIDVASPALLGLPHHHCPYDLIDRVPEAVVTVALYVAACFCLGWAGLTRWLGRCPETEAMLPATVGTLLRFSLGGYVASLVMLFLELALA